ncbi:MAG: DMT family transporter [Chloroflexota bacterium]
MPITLKHGYKPAPPERIKSDALLLFVSFVWGSGFIAQSIAAQSMGNFTFNGVRFFLGAVFLAVLLGKKIRFEQEHLKGVLIAGVLLFAASTLQQIGLETTTAANAGFLTGLYVVIIPLMLWLFGRETIHWTTWTAAILAVIGTLFLSTGGAFEPAAGDWFELAGAFVWAGHVIMVGKMSRKMNNLQFAMGQFTVTAVLNSLGAILLERNTAPLPPAWGAVLYSAIFPVALGFTLQVIGQRNAPTTDAAILFSMEAVFAALLGYLFLKEQLLPLQIFGCFLIFVAMLLAQFRQFLSFMVVDPHSD